ncbi:hypothetical protein E4U34_006687 [Claviceps purpurea]|nr:hypothetical protein E4U34_006687 [Claviceps purpurea]
MTTSAATASSQSESVKAARPTATGCGGTVSPKALPDLLSIGQYHVARAPATPVCVLEPGGFLGWLWAASLEPRGARACVEHWRSVNNHFELAGL